MATENFPTATTTPPAPAPAPGAGLDLDELYAFALDVSKQAGALLLAATQRRTAGSSLGTVKMNSVDLVTETDEQIEAFIKTAVTTRYPTHAFLGEESYTAGADRTYLIDPASSTPTWCVDPLDGTVNFIHLFPMICISIAVIHHGEPVVGVINAPLMGSLFSARTGGGAWHNETTPLPFISPPPPLPANAPRGCIFSCEWGKDRRDVPGGNLHRKAESFITMAAEVGGRGGRGGMVHGVRSLGSAALDLAYTAAGAFDIWWEGGCWEWDVAAGICILREAGGMITNGTPTDPDEIEGMHGGRDGGERELEDVRLGGRKYLGIRPAGDDADTGETGRMAQRRVIREVWKRVVGLDYSRPGG
ncbi:inositol monophosphatase family-domain-containing protein [Geopyxis carbonaria]|nr:inositol monophosphatase family-domain-containing protein [Geopyxis carbonaria]